MTTLRGWLKNLAPLFHPIRGKTKTSLAYVFPRFSSATCICCEFWLVPWIVCVRWLARLITMTWSFETPLKMTVNVDFQFFLPSSSYNLTDYYVPSFDKPDFVCAMKGIPGMQSCNSESIPPSKDHISGRTCTLSFEAYLNETKRSNNSNACVNWNQYYSQCRKEGDNPFWGAIGFDNIFIAWVAIFQVNIKISFLTITINF